MTLIMANQNQKENKFKSDLNKIKKEDINEGRNKCMVQYWNALQETKQCYYVFWWLFCNCIWV